MNRLLAILLAGLLAATLPACSSEEEPDNPRPKKKTASRRPARPAPPRAGRTGEFPAQPGPPGEPQDGPAPLKPGKDTTIITKPLLPDGRPDYLTWLNNRYSRGVTPKNNAAVVFVHTFGANLLDEELLPQQLKLLKTSLPKSTPRNETYPEDPRVQASFNEALKGPWSAQEHSRLATWLYRNRTATHRLLAASKRPRYYFPCLAGASESTETTAPVISVTGPKLGLVRSEAKKLKLRANRATYEGRFDDARRDAHALCNLGRLLQQGMFAIEQLDSLVIWNMGLDAATDLVATGRLSPGQLQRLYAELPALDEQALGQALNQKRLRLLDIVTAVAQAPNLLRTLLQRRDQGLSPLQAMGRKGNTPGEPDRTRPGPGRPPRRPTRIPRQTAPPVEQLDPGPMPAPPPGIAPSGRRTTRRPQPQPQRTDDPQQQATIPPPARRGEPPTAQTSANPLLSLPEIEPAVDAQKLQPRASQAGRLHKQVDFNAVLQRINRYFDQLEALPTLPAGKRKELLVKLQADFNTAAQEAQLEPTRNAEKFQDLDENTSAPTRWMGSLLLVLWGMDPQSASSVTELGLHVAQQRDLLGLAIALELNRQKTGTFPEKLDELVGVYIREVPVDRFASGPPIYRRENNGYVLYSVGPNGKDDGGTESEKVFEGDLVIRVTDPAPVEQEPPATAPARNAQPETQPKDQAPDTQPTTAPATQTS